MARRSFVLAVLGLATVMCVCVFGFRFSVFGPWILKTENRKPKTIDVVWTFEAPERGAIVSSPLVAGEQIYVGVIRDVGFLPLGAVYCLDRATGKIRWQFDDDGAMQQTASSPCLADGRLYIGEGMH